MSQFCGSFCALISRSLLTVILYCANAATASEAERPPARIAILKRFNAPGCMDLPPEEDKDSKAPGQAGCQPILIPQILGSCAGVRFRFVGAMLSSHSAID